ncbi:hypothetical protein V5O48_017969, partial [Marasmius crinis-equi]
MDIVISKTLSEALPELSPLLQATVEQEDAVELFRAVVEEEIVPELKTVIFRHHPTSCQPLLPNMSTLVVPAKEFWMLHLVLESEIQRLQNARDQSGVHIVIYRAREQCASDEGLEEMERALIRVQMEQTAHYFFFEDVNALATSVYYWAA